MTTNFKVVFCLTAKNTGEGVTFKQDGQRFSQPSTIKLNTGTEYELQITLRPDMPVKKLLINGEMYSLEVAHGNKEEDSDSKTYVTQFSTTGYDVSKSGKRKEILLMLEFQSGGYMNLSFQCKLYKAGEISHSQWGQKLTAVHVDCKMEDGHNYITILQEKYL